MTAYERGWSTLKNGELLDEAEKEGFEVLVTTDLNMRYQQNLHSRRIAIIAFSRASWPRIQEHSQHERPPAAVAPSVGPIPVT